MSLRDKFWTENLGALFTSAQVVPLTSMGLAEQLNALTRLMIIIFAIMYLFNFSYAVPFLVISLAFIIILYYIQKRTMQKCQENYCRKPGPLQGTTPLDTSWFTEPPHPSERRGGGRKNTQSHVIRNYPAQTWCNDEVPFQFNNPDWVSPNQKLGQGQNPITRIPPVVIPPSHALDYWKANNLITHSRINTSTQKDAYLSGYAVSTCCGNLEGKTVVPVPGPKYRAYVGGDSTEFVLDPHIEENRENFRSPKPAEVILPMIPSIPVTNTLNQQGMCPTGRCREDFRQNTRRADPLNHQEQYDTLETVRNVQHADIAPNESGWVNTACGYNPEQVFDADLPSNLAAGNCEQDPSMKQYNRNLFTQTIQPGVYTRSQVNEPINANIGISFQQQFEPLTCSRDEAGLHYLEHDPRIIEPALYEPNTAVLEEANTANVYDPRFYGYGTSYRSYTDPLLGQTRFAYDDVDAIRRPNYIVRSKIDFQPYADSYGPMKPGQEMGNPLTGDIRGLAQDSWLRDSLQFRNDMTERLMRKVNAEHWARRAAPKSTMSTKRGGMSAAAGSRNF